MDSLVQIVKMKEKARLAKARLKIIQARTAPKKGEFGDKNNAHSTCPASFHRQADGKLLQTISNNQFVHYAPMMDFGMIIICCLKILLYSSRQIMYLCIYIAYVPGKPTEELRDGHQIQVGR